MNKPFFGFHYDIARGTYIKPEVFRLAIGLAAKSGYTHFLPYLESMIRLPSIERACPSCAYTPHDWASFEKVAKEVSIEIVPHFNVIGHTELLSPAYPELCDQSAPGEHAEFDFSTDATRQWMLRCLAEYCEFSHSDYFLIGGDEWQPSKSKLAQHGFDVAKTWVDQINAAVDFLVTRGRQPIVWHDMLMHYTQARELLSKKAVIAFWFYDSDSDYAALSTFKSLGFKTLMATAVFDGMQPMLTRRNVAALRCARNAVDQHHCDGLMVTSWERCRWELQSHNIPTAAKVILGDEPPAAITDALTLYGAWVKLSAESALARQWHAKIKSLLKDSAWDAAPEMRRMLSAVIDGNVQADVASYLQFHEPQGKGFDRVSKPRVNPDWSNLKQVIAKTDSPFGMKISSDAKHGDILHFENGDESFVIYPKFGASLQSWQRAGHVIIPHSIEPFFKRNMQPGGYRSYNAVGGFRVIWAAGTHSNPSILWQYPWSWHIVEQTSQTIIVELKLQLPLGDFAIRITTENGKPGFRCEANCLNHLEHAYGAFNFNLLLPLDHDDVSNMKIQWESENQKHETTVAQSAVTAFWIPARGPLNMKYKEWTLQVDALPQETAGYMADWNRGFISPDLHGIYRPLKVGQKISTQWRFEMQLNS